MPGLKLCEDSLLLQYDGNHTGLAYCTCRHCSHDGAIILQVTRDDHLEQQRWMNDFRGEDGNICPPLTSQEKQTECLKIRKKVYEDLKDKYLRQLQEKARLQNLESQSTEEPSSKRLRLSPSYMDEDTTAEAQHEREKMESLADIQAETVTDGFMAVYYPNYHYSSKTAIELYGMNGEIIEEASSLRICYKLLEITSLWNMVGGLRRKCPRGHEAIRSEDLPVESTAELTYLTLDNNYANFFPGFLYDLGFMLWLTRQAFHVDWARLRPCEINKSNEHALEVISKFFEEYTAKKVDFAISTSIPKMEVQNVRTIYTSFLIREWGRKVHCRIRAIANTRLALTERNDGNAMDTTD
ncbi:hypothetical protein TWF281_000478 [Arthrobotrys megalospora]